MICPQCGYDMENRHTCLRCGYEVKTLVTVSEEESKKREEKEKTKVIDPSATILTDEYGNSVDEEDYFDPFGSIFDSLFGFDPIGDLLGGLFGMDVRMGRRPQEPKYIPSEEELEQGVASEIGEVVEVKKVEYLDENGEPIKKDGKIKQTVDKVKKKVRDMTHKHDDTDDKK